MLSKGLIEEECISCEINFKFKDSFLWARPTQSFLQKWLREVHNIIIEINYSDCEFWQWIIFCKHLNVHHLGTNETDDINLSYEECLEIALQEALKLI